MPPTLPPTLPPTQLPLPGTQPDRSRPGPPTPHKRTVVIGFFGTRTDGGGKRRWERWRPTASLFQHEDRLVHRLELLIDPAHEADAADLLLDIANLSPETEVVLIPAALPDPWDFEQVYSALYDIAQARTPAPDEDLLVHITTGTHVAQICLFMLAEAHHLRGRLLQTSPGRGHRGPGWVEIDLDLSRYDAIAQRHRAAQQTATELLKRGIHTQNPAFNALIGRLERVCLASRAPVLLTGPTGSGKSELARQIAALKRGRGQLSGPFVAVNCATLRGDQAMATLFGHERGAFTGADHAREGLLRRVDGGLLFLDEIGELGGDEQAMLLHALETGRFLPLGADEEVESHFQLIAGTHRDLRRAVADGRFRRDLLARIDLWHFELPGLAQRPEDLGPNLDFELRQFSERSGEKVVLQGRARERFVRFATAPGSLWSGNFRDLNAAVVRMATLAHDGRVTEADVDAEIARLRWRWRLDGAQEATQATPTPAPDATPPSTPPSTPVSAPGEAAPTSAPGGELDGSERAALLLRPVLGERVEALDRFDLVQLADVVAVCRASSSMSAAGRALFAASMAKRKSRNDSDRLRKYLARFDLRWDDVKGP